MLAQSLVHSAVVEITLKVAHAAGQPAPRILVDMVGLEFAAALGDEFVHHVAQALAPGLGVFGRQIDAYDSKILRQALGISQIVECRRDQAPGKIAGRAENHHRTRRRDRRRNIVIRRTAGLRQAISDLVVLLVRHCPAPHFSIQLPSRVASSTQSRPSNSLAVATTRSGSKPKFRSSPFSGAEARKAGMPMTLPAGPT